jgi:hypothetical protein
MLGSNQRPPPCKGGATFFQGFLWATNFLQISPFLIRHFSRSFSRFARVAARLLHRYATVTQEHPPLSSKTIPTVFTIPYCTSVAYVSNLHHGACLSSSTTCGDEGPRQMIRLHASAPPEPQTIHKVAYGLPRISLPRTRVDKASEQIRGAEATAIAPGPDDSLTQRAAGSVDALLCILEHLPFGSAASLGAAVGHMRASRPIALAAGRVYPSGLVVVQYIGVGVLLQPAQNPRRPGRTLQLPSSHPPRLL